jgi:hypothetical protein
MTDDAHLAGTFIENAAGFLKGASHPSLGVPNDGQLQAASIALELSTKAAILHAGGSDDRNRRELRHDLVRAIDAAEAIGFTSSPAARRFAALLTPYYSTHRLAELDMPAAEFGALLDVAEDHVAAVKEWLA